MPIMKSKSVVNEAKKKAIKPEIAVSSQLCAVAKNEQ